MSCRILFVDDEVPIRELLALRFRMKGMTVTAAATSKEAKAIAKEVAFDLMILDVDLGGESGLDLLDFFKKDKPTIPVIIFTSLANDPNVQKDALARGAIACMSKTEPIDNLLQEVQRAIA